jgi:hypothetical protein
MSSAFTARRVLFGSSILLLAACSDPGTTPLTPMSESASLGQGQSGDRIEAAFQRSSPEVMAIPGTVFSDNDERIGKVVIGIAHMNAEGAVRAAMRRQGVAEGDYEVVLTPEIENKATLRSVFRPTVAGIQVHFGNYVCSIGSNVDHVSTGGRSFIINSHCTNTQGGVEGTTYAQPDRTTDPTIIATEVADPLYVKNGPGCPKGKKCRRSDASRALYSAGTASNRGEIARTTGPNNLSLTVDAANPIFTVTSQDNSTTNFAVGTVVNKVGRTTGWTQGHVDRSCVNTGVSGSQVFLLCQTFVVNAGGAQVVGGGDSGSGVFRITSGSSVQLVGLLWGGSSDNKLFVFSPLAAVQAELGSVNAVK